MAVLEVLTWPDERLRAIATDIPEVNDSVRQLVADMWDTLAWEGGVGLAATQVGVALRVVIIDCRRRDPEAGRRALINPRIVERQGTVIWREGCLSLPGVTAEVERSATVTVEYLDEQGALRSLTTSNLEAVCIQHEMDHLDGQLYVDRLGLLERRATLIEYDEVRERPAL